MKKELIKYLTADYKQNFINMTKTNPKKLSSKSKKLKIKTTIKINNCNKIDSLIQQKYANDNFDCRREISLWKGVILQALVDLKSRSKKKMAKVNRVKSILWLNLQNKDFLIACSYADLDPLYVWEKAQILKKNNPMI